MTTERNVAPITGRGGAYPAELLREEGCEARSNQCRADTGRIGHLYQDPHVDQLGRTLH